MKRKIMHLSYNYAILVIVYAISKKGVMQSFYSIRLTKTCVFCRDRLFFCACLFTAAAFCGMMVSHWKERTGTGQSA